MDPKKVVLFPSHGENLPMLEDEAFDIWIEMEYSSLLKLKGSIPRDLYNEAKGNLDRAKELAGKGEYEEASKFTLRYLLNAWGASEETISGLEHNVSEMVGKVVDRLRDRNDVEIPDEKYLRGYIGRGIQTDHMWGITDGPLNVRSPLEVNIEEIAQKIVDHFKRYHTAERQV